VQSFSVRSDTVKPGLAVCCSRPLAKLKNVLHSLAAVFIVLPLRNEAEFKSGAVSLELYDLFFPKYRKFKGRVAVMNFTWL
jgi:hypothetical protein